MATLTFPPNLISSVVWKLVSRTQVFTSPLTGSSQTLELPGALWAADINFTVMNDAEKRQLSAFLVALRGRSGRFYLTDPSNSAISGSGAGAPVVDSSVGYTPAAVGISGLTPSATGVFKAGDMLGFSNDELKMVIEDVDADGSGEALVKVEPPFRTQPTDTSEVVTANPTCIMRLVDDAQAAWQAQPGQLFQSKISCIEAFV